MNFKVVKIKRVRVLVGFTFACLALVEVSAWSHDHRPPPDPALSVGTKRQIGRPIHVSWVKRIDENECEWGDGSGSTTFPGGIRFSPGSIATIVLDKESPPREWQLQAWRAINRKGRPKGDPESVPAVLAPRAGGGLPDRWELRFTPPVPAEHLYLRLDVFWADEEGCGGTPDLGSQQGTWTYHLRPPS